MLISPCCPPTRCAVCSALKNAASPEQIARATQIVHSNGRGAHEEEIARLVEEGHRTLDAAQFAPQASGMLRELCDILTSRRA